MEEETADSMLSDPRGGGRAREHQPTVADAAYVNLYVNIKQRDCTDKYSWTDIYDGYVIAKS